MENSEPKNWLTVDDAYSLALKEGLHRTKKTVRQWCRQGHVEAQKRITPNGEAWMIDAKSLETKIQSEIEFSSAQSIEREPVRPSSNLYDRIQTGAHQFEHVRTGENIDEPDQSASVREEISNLKATIRSLEIDKGIRDAQIKYLEDENLKGREALSGQSRYIGHLETLATQNGSSPDAKFLASPVPKLEIDPDLPLGEIVNPAQPNLGYNSLHGNDG